MLSLVEGCKSILKEPEDLVLGLSAASEAGLDWAQDLVAAEPVVDFVQDYSFKKLGQCIQEGDWTMVAWFGVVFHWLGNHHYDGLFPAGWNMAKV